jgi:hypothetical protein
VFALRPKGRFWVIAGGESRQSTTRLHHKLDLQWIEALVDECATSGVPVFVKQLGYEPHRAGAPYVLKLDRNHGGDLREWPEWLKLREFPPSPSAA